MPLAVTWRWQSCWHWSKHVKLLLLLKLAPLAGALKLMVCPLGTLFKAFGSTHRHLQGVGKGCCSSRLLWLLPPLIASV